MNKNLLFIAAAALMITGCSEESVVDSEINKMSNAIGFDTYKSVTKGNPEDNNGEFIEDGNTFGVTAFISGTSTSPYMGYAEKGASIKSDGTKWGYVNANEQAYWPTKGETLDFYAYSPFGNDAITQTFDKTNGLTINYTVPALEKDQVDLMFASKIGVAKPTASNSVELPFKHALTQVHFGIATKTDRLKVDVDASGIVLNRINSKGTFAAQTEVWDPLADLTNYIVTSAAITAGYEVNKTTKYAKIGTDTEALMLLPQAFVAATVDAEGAVVGTEGSYLTINCKIYQELGDGTKVYLHGTEAASAIINVPFSSVGMVKDVSAEVWLRNKKVTYNLLIGAGGAGGLDPIEFTTTVEEWLPADGGVVENK